MGSGGSRFAFNASLAPSVRRRHAPMTQPAPPPIRPIFAVLPVLVWLGFAVYWGFQTQVVLEQQRYREVEAKVERVTLKEGAPDRASHNCRGNRDRFPRTVWVRYSYTVDGKQHTGTHYDAAYESELFCEGPPARERAERLKAAGKVTVYYAPDDPSRAVIAREHASEAVFVWVLIAIGGVVMGVLLVRWWVRRAKAERALGDDLFLV